MGLTSKNNRWFWLTNLEAKPIPRPNEQIDQRNLRGWAPNWKWFIELSSNLTLLFSHPNHPQSQSRTTSMKCVGCDCISILSSGFMGSFNVWPFPILKEFRCLGHCNIHKYNQIQDQLVDWLSSCTHKPPAIQPNSSRLQVIFTQLPLSLTFLMEYRIIITFRFYFFTFWTLVAFPVALLVAFPVALLLALLLVLTLATARNSLKVSSCCARLASDSAFPSRWLLCRLRWCVQHVSTNMWGLKQLK